MQHVDRERERLVEVGFRMVALREKRVRLFPFVSDSALLFGHQVGLDRLGVVELEELLALGVEPPNSSLLTGTFGGGGAAPTLEMISSGPTCELLLLSGQRHVPVQAFHLAFDLVHREVGQRAGRTALLAVDAEEVGVDPSLASAGVGDDQTSATHAAPDGRFQIMRVVPGLLAIAMGSHDLLNPRKGRIVNERWVLAWILDTLEHDETPVVRVAQDLVHLRPRYRLLCVLGRRAGGQPAISEEIADVGDRVLAGGVLLERPADVLGAVRVQCDRSHLSPLHLFSHVEVSERRVAWGAALFRLLKHALPSLRREVAGVELGNAGHDAVDELSLSAVVD